MISINDIYKSVDADCTPKQRTMDEVRLVLERSYILIQLEDFKELELFDKNSNEVVNRVSIERAISDLKYLPTQLEKKLNISSKGFEMVIRDLDNFDTLFSVKEKPFDFPIQVKAPLYSILVFTLTLAKSQLLEIKKKLIKESLSKIPGKDGKINFLNERITILKQNARSTDSKEQIELIQFAELEIEKWSMYKDTFSSFTSTNELWIYLTEVLNKEVIKTVRLNGGYKNFWRTQDCTQPKTEAETQQYIRTLFEPHCIRRNINISSESVAANGRMDLAFNYLGFNVCLEIKNAHHPDVENAANTQLPLYMEGLNTTYGLYIVLWCKSVDGFTEPKKYRSLDELKYIIEESLISRTTNVCMIDCTKPKSPSKL